jgi:hypothetical protein
MTALCMYVCNRICTILYIGVISTFIEGVTSRIVQAECINVEVIASARKQGGGGFRQILRTKRILTPDIKISL